MKRTFLGQTTGTTLSTYIHPWTHARCCWTISWLAGGVCRRGFHRRRESQRSPSDLSHCQSWTAVACFPRLETRLSLRFPSQPRCCVPLAPFHAVLHVPGAGYRGYPASAVYGRQGHLGLTARAIWHLLPPEHGWEMKIGLPSRTYRPSRSIGSRKMDADRASSMHFRYIFTLTGWCRVSDTRLQVGADIPQSTHHHVQPQPLPPMPRLGFPTGP